MNKGVYGLHVFHKYVGDLSFFAVGQNIFYLA